MPNLFKLLHYEVWRIDNAGGGTVLVGTHNETIYYDTTVTNGTGYRYFVKAVDTMYQTSIASTTLPAAPDWAIPRDSIPPGPPIGVVAFPTNQSDQVQLTWTANLEPDLDHYLVGYRLAGGGSFVNAPGAPSSATSKTIAALNSAQLYEFQVIAVDTSGNQSAPVVVSATTRSDLLPTVTLGANCGWEIDYDCLQSNPDCPHPQSIDSTDITAENYDTVQVRLEWSFNSAVPRDGVRIYRGAGDGSPDSWMLIADIADPNATEFLDLSPSSWSHHYRVATYQSGVESTYTQTASALEDLLDADYGVRNIRAIDGRRYSTADRAIMELNYLEWSPSLETQVVGYNLYRLCAWPDCTYGDVDSTPALTDPHCVPSWVRLNDLPLVDTHYTDILDGLPACYNYAVRPVTQDGVEGDVRKLLAVANSDPNFHDSDLHAYDMAFEQMPFELHFSETTYERINDPSRGTGSPTGIPDAPANVRYAVYTEEPWENRSVPTSRYLEVLWDANDESDLRGYWVEFSWSPSGPWHRYTDKPIAWWETSYYQLAVQARGHNALPTCTSTLTNSPCGPANPSVPCIYEEDCPDLDCLHVRVIAVDESGNESPPSSPSDHPRSGCPTSTAPVAPSGVSAAFNAWVDPYPHPVACETRVSWDDSGATDYEVHRFVWWTNNSWFYITGEVSGATCSAGSCHFDESGDHPGDIGPFSSSPCPMHVVTQGGVQSHSCSPEFWQAFYVVGKNYATNGTPIRSEPSEIIWFHCPDAASANLQWPAESSDEVPVLYAEQPQCQPGDVRQSHELLTAALRPPSPEFEEAPSINLASLISPPAQLGQAPSNPPYTVLRVHVDHLGSTRRVTNPSGSIIAEHDFLPFGEEITPFEPWGSKLFAGHERDRETGLDYMLGRYSSIRSGRFVTVDPSRRSIARFVPQTWNRFTFLLNNPLNRIDPTGEVSYLVARDIPATVDTKVHMFVVTGAKYPGDTGPDVKIHSFGKGQDGKLRRMAPGSEVETTDRNAWASLATGQPVGRPDYVAIPAKDGKVDSVADAVVENHDYELFGPNSNSAAQAIADRAAGRPVEPPIPEDGINGESEEAPGSEDSAMISFDETQIANDKAAGKHSRHKKP